MLSNRNTNDAWAAITTERARDLLEMRPELVVGPTPQGMVRVPEGHSVTVVSLASEPYAGPTTFGYYVADFGPTGVGESALIKDVAVAQGEDPSTKVLWIIQSGAAMTWSARAGMIDLVFSEFHSVISSATPQAHIAVVGEDSSAVREVVRRLHSLGVGVHATGPDGAAMVAVRLPDGTIQIRMPGPAVL